MPRNAKNRKQSNLKLTLKKNLGKDLWPHNSLLISLVLFLWKLFKVRYIMYLEKVFLTSKSEVQTNTDHFFLPQKISLLY